MLAYELGGTTYDDVRSRDSLRRRALDNWMRENNRKRFSGRSEIPRRPGTARVRGRLSLLDESAKFRRRPVADLLAVKWYARKRWVRQFAEDLFVVDSENRQIFRNRDVESPAQSGDFDTCRIVTGEHRGPSRQRVDPRIESAELVGALPPGKALFKPAHLRAYSRDKPFPPLSGPADIGNAAKCETREARPGKVVAGQSAARKIVARYRKESLHPVCTGNVDYGNTGGRKPVCLLFGFGACDDPVSIPGVDAAESPEHPACAVEIPV